MRVLVLIAAAAGLAACASSGRDESLERLNDRIEQLGGPNAHPVVSLDLFFDENDDPASIGPNLDPHPGVRTFERVLKEIRDRPEVSDVVVQIDEVIEGEWPYAPAAYVVTTASPQQVHEWALEIQPDEYVGEDVEMRPWLFGDRPPGAPRIPEGHRVVTLFWD